MRTNIISTLVAILLLTGAVAGAQGADVVYVTYPEEDGIFAWSTTSDSTPVPIYTAVDSNFEDLVVGPNGDLWACDPDPITGSIVQLTPQFAGGVPTTASVQAVYPLPGYQCGWFTHYGDLIVTEKYGSGVYFLPFSNPGDPQLLVDFGGDVTLEGVTQEADGDLLVVDSYNGAVIRVPFDLNIRYPYVPVGEKGDLGWFETDYTVDDEFIVDLAEPVGIARSSKGGIFVAASDGVYSYGYDEFGDLQPLGECPDLGVGNRERPYFLEFADDDTLYISMTRKNSTQLVQANINCTWTVLSEIGKRDLDPPVVGMAVPYLEPLLNNRFIPGTWVDPDVYPLPDPEAQVFTFNDHAYEFKSDPSGCEVVVTAAEATPGELADLLLDIDFDLYDPDYPGCADVDDPTHPCDVTGNPILNLGENGRGTLYEVLPAGSPLPPECDGDVQPLLFRHAINAFTGYVPNPRLVKCPSPGDLYQCYLIDLATFFPFNGIIPDDARISGATSSAASDFSRFFVIDLDLNEDADTGDGHYCGFQSPWTEPTGVNWLDPDVLDYLDPTTLTAISTTEAFALKFQIAEITGYTGGEPDYDCGAGPFLPGATVLMSIAKVREADYTTEVFVPKDIFASGSSAVVDPAVFNDGGSPTKQYHFNAKFPADEYEPGIYQLVLVPLTNNFAAEVRYFRIVE